MLKKRYKQTDEMTNLKKAVRLARQAVKSTLHNYPSRANWLNSLGTKLGSRYKQTGKMADLKETIRLARQAVK